MIIYIADYLDGRRPPSRAKRGLTNHWSRTDRSQERRSSCVAHAWRAPVAFAVLPRSYPMSPPPEMSTLYAEASLV